MTLVKTNVVLHAPVVGLSLTKLKTAIDLVSYHNTVTCYQMAMILTNYWVG